MRLMLAGRAFNNMAGGVERIGTMLANEMVGRGHEVHLLTWDGSDARAFYPLRDEVRWHRLAIGDPKRAADWLTRLRRCRRVRKIVKAARPDVILAFQHGTFLSMRCFTTGLMVPVIAAERNAPSRLDFTRAGKHRRLIFQSLRLADRVTIQCPSYQKEYPKYLHERLVTIPNPVISPLSTSSMESAGDAPHKILAVGRLSYQKNFEALIDAFAELPEDCREWRLTIAGEGELEQNLRQRIEQKGLQARVEMVGPVVEIEKYYREAAIFCLPSRWEGFPNALAEALAHGVPAVGFAGCAGVRDLIEPGFNGILAEGNGDPKALASALRELIQAPRERQRMGDEAKSIVDRYSPDVVFGKWEKLFDEVAR